MPTEPHTPTLAEVVRAGAEAADPTGSSDVVTEFIARFEDRDEPVSAVDNVEELLAEARGAIGLDDETLSLAVAVATYLAFRRDQIGAEREELIRLATRAEDVA